MHIAQNFHLLKTFYNCLQVAYAPRKYPGSSPTCELQHLRFGCEIYLPILPSQCTPVDVCVAHVGNVDGPSHDKGVWPSNVVPTIY